MLEKVQKRATHAQNDDVKSIRAEIIAIEFEAFIHAFFVKIN